MRFASPEWLLLLPLLAIVAWRWPALGLRRPLRAALLLLLLLLLMRPEIMRLRSGLELWVLADRSASAEELVGPRLPEILALLRRSKGADDEIRIVDFADTAIRQEADTGQGFPGSRRRTRLASAIEYALSESSPDRAVRILALTDGFSTEPLDRALARLRDQDVALDYRLFGHPGAADYRVADLEVPARVGPAEPFLVEARITGAPDDAVPYVVERNGQILRAGNVEVRNGSAVLRFTDRLPDAGAYRYALTLRPVHDAHAGNNRAARWIEVTGGARVLLLTAYPDDPLAGALAGEGHRVEVITSFDRLDVGSLTGTRAVLIHNVPSWKLPDEFLRALDFYVRAQGGGLMMVGGKQSFGAGGYFQSALDPLLPVSMELKQEHRKLAVAMAVVLDRSGSMMAGVSGTGLTKMDLANEGAARGIELLGAMDAVSVIAVDSEPHVMVPLTRLGMNRGEILSATRRIQSTGGGIYVYTGLKAAWEQLENAKQGQRHIILFADAADAEEPGDYIALLDKITDAGATVSVIGMGTEKDVDADFLKDVALRGKGRIFFGSDANTLPVLFAQETIAVARSAFVDSPVALNSSASWLELAARPIEWVEGVDGYNLSYLRDGATAAALSGDEYAAPLIAFWQRGIGRVAAVSFPLGGDFSRRVRDWPAYGDFARTLTRWLVGGDAPAGIALRTERTGDVLDIALFYDERWEDRIAQRAPRLVLARGADGSTFEPAWQRMAPGLYSSRVPMDGEDWLRGAAQVLDTALPFGPVNAGVDAEWSFDRERIAELKSVAARSGGGERVDLASIWKAPRQRRFADIQSPLWVLFMALFLAEAAWTRLGGRRPEPSVRARPSAAANTDRRRRRQPEAPAVKPVAPPPVPEHPEPPPRRSIFDQARRRGR